MRPFPKHLATKVASKKIKELYTNFEKYTDIEYLSNLLDFEVLYATQWERDAYRFANSVNDDMLETVVASLPSYCGACYMVIRYDDRIQAVEIGLNVTFI